MESMYHKKVLSADRAEVPVHRTTRALSVPEAVTVRMASTVVQPLTEEVETAVREQAAEPEDKAMVLA